MKKYLIIAATMLLSACSSLSSDTKINFDPEASTSGTKITQDISFTLTSQDERAVKYIAVLKSDGNSEVQTIQASKDVRSVYEAAIYQQFYSQGFYATRNSPNIININVVDTLATITQSRVQYEISTKVTVEITAETPKGKFVKNFFTSGTKSAPLTASPSEVEEILNSQATTVLQSIATDSELKNYMMENF